MFARYLFVSPFRVAHVLEPLHLCHTGNIITVVTLLYFHSANADTACKLGGAQNKLFGTTTLSVAGKMRKQMVKQVVADGLPKPVRRTNFPVQQLLAVRV